MKYLNLIGYISLLLLTGCEQPQTVSPDTIHDDLQQQFEIWRKTQNQQVLEEYQQYLAQQLKRPPGLFELY